MASSNPARVRLVETKPPPPVASSRTRGSDKRQRTIFSHYTTMAPHHFHRLSSRKNDGCANGCNTMFLFSRLARSAHASY